MKTYAKFIGKNGSCNLKHGQIYRIEIVETKPTARFHFYLFVDDRFFGIPYDTMKGIRKNWLFPL